MLVLDDVCFAYGEVQVLDCLSAEVRRGETVLLSGANGAGKSTLLRLLNGLSFPQRGTYAFEGTQITEKKLHDTKYAKWFHQRVGYVFQQPDAQLFCSSVWEELAFGPRQMGLSETEVARRVRDALALLGLEKLAERPPYVLSGGEKKRTAIAAVFTMNPAVWTMDEPESYLDAEGLAWLQTFLPRLKEAGKTLVITTHHPEMFQGMVDREIAL